MGELKNVELSALRKMLPHGAINEIAEKAGVKAPTVSRAFKGDKRSPKLPDIVKATAEYFTEYRAKQEEANRAIKKAVQTD